MQNIVICGGTSGFGKAMAYEFVKRNNNVIIAGRNSSKLRDVRKIPPLNSIDSIENRITTFQCDVRNYKHIEKLADYANYVFDDKIDIWINSAALCEGPIEFDKLSLSEIDDIISTNLNGTIYGCKIALDSKVKNIYNISGHGSQGGKTPGFPIYGLCKSAIQQFTNTISDEHENIHTIVPGLMKTKITEKLFEDTKFVELFAQTPERVAKAIVPKILKNKSDNQLIMF
jgi:short-subunit dehydrogenase